jgi:hypothetical protein
MSMPASGPTPSAAPTVERPTQEFLHHTRRTVQPNEPARSAMYPHSDQLSMPKVETKPNL